MNDLTNPCAEVLQDERQQHALALADHLVHVLYPADLAEARRECPDAEHLAHWERRMVALRDGDTTFDATPMDWRASFPMVLVGPDHGCTGNLLVLDPTTNDSMQESTQLAVEWLRAAGEPTNQD